MDFSLTPQNSGTAEDVKQRRPGADSSPNFEQPGEPSQVSLHTENVAASKLLLNLEHSHV